MNKERKEKESFVLFRLLHKVHNIFTRKKQRNKKKKQRQKKETKTDRSTNRTGDREIDRDWKDRKRRQSDKQTMREKGRYLQ